MSSTEHGDSLLTALVSGCSSAAFVAFATFPLDFLKTLAQLDNSHQLKKFNAPGFQPSSIAQIMKGSSALVTGNVLKNFTRILLYNWSSNFMAIDSRSDQKKTSAPRVVIAGAMSATIETFLIIPTERIKITMIQNQILANEIANFPDKNIDITGVDKHHKLLQSIFARQYVSPHSYYTHNLLTQLKSGKGALKFQPPMHAVKGPSAMDALKLEFNKTPALTLLGTIRQMYAIHQLRGFFNGTFITYARQIGSSAAWFSTYNATRQLLDPHTKTEEQNWFRFQHSAWQLIGLHVISAAAVIAATQPLDVIKTHIQSKNGYMLYKDSLSTAYKIFVRKGIMGLFAGSVPRGVKIGINGSLTALFYQWIDGGINTLATKTVFTD
uniref:Mitochondrial carrier protein n=1 Tax=Candidozyma auris TaxID=498019 RepID=A0A0L0P0B3_CANAR